MAIGEDIEKRGHITGFQEEIAKAAKESQDAFFTWFDATRDKDSAFVRGSWDFLYHIAHPVASFLKDPEEKEALEIGHGGGRILAAASRCFKKANGVDIHENNELVEEELKSRGIENFELRRSDGKSIPYDDQSIDFVYTFIVLQHVEKIAIFEHYLEEAYRVLKPGALAMIYFGRPYWLSVNRTRKWLFWLDCLLEKILVPSGYQELPARVNCTNLNVTRGYARRKAEALGFRVEKAVSSYKSVPNFSRCYGAQHGLLLRKP